MRTTTFLFATLASMILPACDSEGDDTGTAPSLEAVTLATDDLHVGMTTAVSGSLAFTDPDGDLSSAEIELSDPSGSTVSISTPITGVTNTTQGTVAIQLLILPTVAGPHEATFTLLDSEGNESDPQVAAFEVLP